MKVSVVIPTYNREKVVVGAINSVLSQTLPPDEIIIVDDCSNDETISVIKQNFGDKVRLIENNENRGACYCRNVGIKLSKYQYVAFQDSDDYWLPHKLELQLGQMIEDKASFSFSRFIKVFEHAVELYPAKNFSKFKDLKTILKNPCSTQTIIIDKNICKFRFDEKLSRFQDWDFYFSAIDSDCVISFVEEPTAIVKLSDNSISKNYQAGLNSRLHIYSKLKEIKRFGSALPLVFIFGYYIRKLFFIFRGLKRSESN